MEYVDAIKVYLAFVGRLTNNLEFRKHYTHIEPFKALEVNQILFYITIDIEKDLANPLNI